MTAVLLVSVYIFALSCFLGLDVLGKVAPNIHALVLAGIGGLTGIVAVTALAPAGPDPRDPLVLAGTALAAAAAGAGFVATGRLRAGSDRRGKRS